MQPDNDTPADCHVCGRHAIGLGIGRLPNDPRWLCRECADIVEYVRSAKRLDAYELKARAGGVEAAGEYLRGLGKTDLAEFEEEEAEILCGKIWRGCADRLREIIRNGDAPF